MKFQDLPVSVQEIAAKTLSEMMLRPDDKKEPAKLAQEVKSAFSGLFSDAVAPVRGEAFGGKGPVANISDEATLLISPEYDQRDLLSSSSASHE